MSDGGPVYFSQPVKTLEAFSGYGVFWYPSFSLTYVYFWSELNSIMLRIGDVPDP